jgi:hypothetical protein
MAFVHGPRCRELEPRMLVWSSSATLWVVFIIVRHPRLGLDRREIAENRGGGGVELITYGVYTPRRYSLAPHQNFHLFLAIFATFCDLNLIWGVALL